ncbi:MAG TPA: flagellar filament capping protein FliD [Terracidiphilus sp.]|jgi:flagellar hook-associated protein 2
MGTVGLSFGSPTSGAGFNVSSTVAEIVGNLQNVETPWKNQLTSLESQDSVISSLGTLFSNLSNDMSSLTDFQGVLAQKEGSSSDTGVLELTAASSSATAGTHTVVVNNLAQTSSGYLDSVADASDALSGSMTIELGNGTTENIVIGAAPATPAANTIYTGSGKNTLANIASALNSANLGLTANVLADSSGSRLSIVSGASGKSGQLSVTSALTDSNNVTTANPVGTLNYNVGVDGKDASLTIDGVPLTSASNTASNLIPGVTFQLLAPSTLQSGNTQESIQVVIANDNAGVESTVNQFVNDYNSLIGAINTQEGHDSSGNPEPLFGSPTLSLLQQQLLGSLNRKNPGGSFDSLSSTTNATLSGSITLSLAGGIPLYYSGAAGTAAQASFGSLAPINNAADTLSGSITIAVGGAAAQTINIGDSSTPDTLAGLAQAINLAGIGVSAQVESNATSSWLSLTSNTSGKAGTLTVNSSVADTTPQTIQVPSSAGINSLAGLADAINSSLCGATAAVITANGNSTLTLTSEVEGSNGALTVTSALDSSTPAPLDYSETASYTDSTPDIGALGDVAASGDTLSGSLTIQVGSGTAETIVIGAAPSQPAANTIYTGSGADTLSDVMDAINSLSGVFATPNQDSTGITLTSAADGAAGALTVTSHIVDTGSPNITELNYNASSDIGSLTTLGISVNNDGSLTFDAGALDSLLNTDYASVNGFFQNANSWGQTFNNILTGAGTGSSTGILSLAKTSNSRIESTLNANISREQGLIAAEQSSLTLELNQANEMMQQLPTELEGMNQLYSAITGYNQNR